MFHILIFIWIVTDVPFLVFTLLFVVFLFSFLGLSLFIHLLLPSFLSSHSLLTYFRGYFF
jgi:hypothetical protein